MPPCAPGIKSEVVWHWSPQGHIETGITASWHRWYWTNCPPSETGNQSCCWSPVVLKATILAKDVGMISKLNMKYVLQLLWFNSCDYVYTRINFAYCRLELWPFTWRTAWSILVMESWLLLVKWWGSCLLMSILENCWCWVMCLVVLRNVLLSVSVFKNERPSEMKTKMWIPQPTHSLFDLWVIYTFNSFYSNLTPHNPLNLELDL